jgi:hypothetical protein
MKQPHPMAPAMAPAGPNAAPSSPGRGACCALVATAIALGACGGERGAPAAAPVSAPAWEPIAFAASDADLVGAIDLAAVRADPLFGPLVAKLASHDDLGVLSRASQIDLVASADDGNPSSWIAVVHGVDGPPRDGDLGGRLGKPQVLPSGATEYRGSSAGDVVTVPGVWVVGAGSGFDRVRARPGVALARIALPDRVLFASTIQGRALPRPRHAELLDVTEGLKDATMAVLGGTHLEVVMQCRYVDAAAARHAATAARLVLVAEADRMQAVSALARELGKLDFDVHGEVVSLRVTISDDLRELLQSYVEREAG